MPTIQATQIRTEGNILYIKSEPAIGVLTLVSFSDDAAGVSGGTQFIKTFRYSKNGVTWSDWITLTTPNITGISVSTTDTLCIELAYEKVQPLGSDILSVTEVTINTTETAFTEGQYFEKSIFSQFFESRDTTVLGWYISVLEKLYEKGIIPPFIERLNEFGLPDDYVDFWKSITKYFAYIVVYARSYQDFPSNILLIFDYLLERGMTVSINNTLGELNYLMNSFYKEIGRRGTVHIIDDEFKVEEAVFGELLRLINYNEDDEFLFNLYKPEHFGWKLGKSSPMYRGMTGNDNVSRNNYTTFPDGKQYKKISPYLPYEITFSYQIPAGSKVSFFLRAKNGDGTTATLLSAQDGSSTNAFLTDYTPMRTDMPLFFRLIIFPFTESPGALDVLECNAGHNLIFTPDCHDIALFISNDISSVITEITGFSIGAKITPLVSEYSRGFIQSKNFISVWLENKNKDYNLRGLEEHVKKYLIPYNSNIKITEIRNSNSGVTPPSIDVSHLSISKMINDSRPTYLVGESVNYRVDIVNTGTTDFTGINMVDILDSKLTFDSASSPFGTPSYSSGVVSMTVDVPAGETVFMLITCLINASGDIENNCKITFPDIPIEIDGVPVTFTASGLTFIDVLRPKMQLVMNNPGDPLASHANKYEFSYRDDPANFVNINALQSAWLDNNSMIAIMYNVLLAGGLGYIVNPTSTGLMTSKSIPYSFASHDITDKLVLTVSGFAAINTGTFKDVLNNQADFSPLVVLKQLEETVIEMLIGDVEITIDSAPAGGPYILRFHKTAITPITSPFQVASINWYNVSGMTLLTDPAHPSDPDYAIASFPSLGGTYRVGVQVAYEFPVGQQIGLAFSSRVFSIV